MSNFSGYSREAADVPYFSSNFSTYTREPAEVPYFSNVVLPPSKDEQIVIRRLFIDNRDRFNFPNTSPFDFKIYLGNDPERSVGISGYENVTSVELKAVSFPKVAGERYVILSIDELNDDMLDATCAAAHNSFAIVYFDTDALAAGTVKPLKGSDFYLKQMMFRPPLARLNSLSIKFLNHAGDIITPAHTNNEAHVSLVLEIRTRVNR